MHDVWGDVRAVLPVWVGWFCLVLPLLAGPWAWVSTRMCIALALRGNTASPSAGSHWTERARLWYPPRRAARTSMLAFVLAAGFLSALQDGPLHRVPAELCAWLGASCALIGGWSAASALERRARPGLLARTQLVGSATLCLVMFPHVIVAVAAAFYLPAHVDGGNLWQFLLALIALVASAAGGGIWLSRLLGLLRPAGERVRRAVSRAAEQLGHTPRAVYSLPISSANAFAFPLLDCLAFSPLAESKLDDDELAAVAAHEIAHLTEPTGLQYARVLAALWMVGPICISGLLFATFDYYAAIAILLNALVSVVVFRRFSQRMEARADHAAHESPGYARALEALYRENLAPAVLAGRGAAHPHLYDRLIAAGVTPDYPRPAPPPRRPLTFLALLISLYALIFLPFAVYLLRTETPSDGELHLELAVQGGSAWELGELGRRRWEQQRFEEASRLFRAALQLSPANPHYTAGLIWTLSNLARCEEARSELEAQIAALQPSAAEAQQKLIELRSALIDCGR